MATKRKAKKSSRVSSVIEMPEISPEQLEKAKKLILGQSADVPYHIAKRYLMETLEMSKAEANATVVKLHEEGFLAGEKNIFRLPNAKVQYGIVRGARFREDFTVVCQDDPETEIPLNPHWTVLPGDVMEIRPSVGRQTLRIAGMMPRVQKRWVCKLADDGWNNRKGLIVLPVNAFAPVHMVMERAEGMPPVDVLQKSAFEVELLEDGETPTVHGDLKCRFVKTIGNRFDPLGEIAIAAAEYDLPVEFSPEALQEAEALPDEVDGKSMRGRVDLRDLPFVTIDGEDARDFDDAVYCIRESDNEWRLLVAIADVSHYVRPKTPLDMDAQRRGTSVYFPASVVPMLPKKLSNGLCSLNPMVDRLTLVCDALVNAAGET
ncbi:ribonuclease R, partial [gut metagenome]